MNDLIHADIFFFVATIATVVIAIGVGVALFFTIGILRDVREIVGKARKASGELEQDFEELRASVKSESLKARAIVGMVLALVARYIPRARKSSKKADEE